jgi:hypothetical protein
MSQSTKPDVIAEFQLPQLPSGKVDVTAWIEQLGVAPISDLDELSTGVWPDDESVDEFLAARRRWRADGTAGPEDKP